MGAHNCNDRTHERYCVACGYTVPITTQIGRCPECKGLEFRFRERTVDADGNPVFGKPPHGKHWEGMMTASEHRKAIQARSVFQPKCGDVEWDGPVEGQMRTGTMTWHGSVSGRARTNGDHMRNVCRTCGTSHPIGAEGFCKCGMPLPKVHREREQEMSAHTKNDPTVFIGGRAYAPVGADVPEDMVVVRRGEYNALVELLQEAEAFRHGEGNKVLLKWASRVAMDHHEGGYMKLREDRLRRLGDGQNPAQSVLNVGDDAPAGDATQHAPSGGHLGTGYQDLSDSDIINMPHGALVDAMLRMTHVPFRTFAPSDSHGGAFLLPDDLADAFRNRC